VAVTVTTNREYEQFERDFGYCPCFKSWDGGRCDRPAGHADECVCHNGSRHFWPKGDKYEPRPQTETLVETRRRPTLEELENILNREPDAPIDIRPDGSVRMPERLQPKD
jgi:hypothetical protein